MKLLLMLTMIAAFALPSFIEAHAHLTTAFPADGSVLKAAPDRLILMFSEVARLTALSIQKDGETLSLDVAPLPKDASASFALHAPVLGDGTYVLTYRVLASRDNHVSSGVVKFTVSMLDRPYECSSILSCADVALAAPAICPSTSARLKMFDSPRFDSATVWSLPTWSG